MFQSEVDARAAYLKEGTEAEAEMMTALTKACDDLVDYLKVNRTKVRGFSITLLGDPLEGLYDPARGVVSMGLGRTVFHDSITHMLLLQGLEQEVEKLR